MFPLALGFLLIAFDPRKQGLHDKLAGTLVIVDWAHANSWVGQRLFKFWATVGEPVRLMR